MEKASYIFSTKVAHSLWFRLYFLFYSLCNAVFPFRGEAPPPYEEAVASGCIQNSFVTLSNNNNVNTTILTNENINHQQATEPSAPSILQYPANSQEIANQIEPIPGPSNLPPTTLALSGPNTNNVAPNAPLPEYSAVAFAPSRRDCFRHSLTLPRRPNLDEIREFGLDLNDGSSNNNNYFRRNRQRFSLQLNVNVDDSSSSSSTMSLSASITPIDHRNPISSSSSSSTNIYH